jgi:DivIVA domain-containing protein
VVDDQGSKTSGKESETSPEAQDQELSVHEFRDHVPADIRNVSFPVSLRGYDRPAVDAYVTRVNRVIAELEVSRSPQAAVRHALDRVGEQTISVLREARESAEKIAATAREEAEETIGRAKAHAANLVVSASAEAEGEKAEAEQIVAGARAEANDIRLQSEAEAEKILARSRAEAAENLQRTQHEIAALTGQAEARMRELDADTKAVWKERDELLDEVHGLATRLQDLAGAAAVRVSSQKTAEPTEERTPEPQAEAEAERAGVAATGDPAEETSMVGSLERSARETPRRKRSRAPGS